MLVTPTASAGSHSARARGRVARISAAKGSPTRLGGAHAAKATVPATRRQGRGVAGACTSAAVSRSEEHTSELQSRLHLVCRLLLEKKKKKNRKNHGGSDTRRQQSER